MTETTVVIIGGGLAGLSAGCYARMNGFKTLILEHEKRPGGVCTAWNRGGYTFDGCIHWLVGFRPGDPMLEVYGELGIADAVPRRQLDAYLNFIDENSGRELRITSDFEATREAMVGAAPEDRRAIERFLRDSLSFSAIEMPVDPPGEMRLARRMRLMWQWRKAVFQCGTYGRPAEEYARRFRDPFMQRLMGLLFHPRMPVIFNMMVLGWLFGRNLFSIEGGSLQFSRAVERRYLELGGEVSYKTVARKILVEDGQAVGVECEDGSVHRADIVISASDLHQTVYGLLGGAYVSDRLSSLFAHGEVFDPILIISCGVRGEGSSHPPTSMIMLGEGLDTGGRVVNEMAVRDFAGDPSLSPEGGRVIQAIVETNFEHWNRLRQEDRERYDAEKRRIADKVVERLEHYYPGIGARVEVRDVATPATFLRRTRNWRGSYEGWIMTVDNAFRRPLEKTLPGLRNLYLCGQWVEPGGGVPTVLLSGRNAVRMICRNEGMEFAAQRRS